MAVHELFTLIEQSDVDGLPTALIAKADQSALDTLEGRVDGHDTSIAAKANDSAVVHNTGNETINGQKTIPAGTGNTWTFNGPVAVAQGTLTYHAARRDEVAAKADLEHTHDASDIDTGTLDVAVLPPVLWGTSSNTTTQVGSLTIDLTGITFPFRVKVIQNHDAGVIAPSSGMYDGQVIKVVAYANGGARQFVFSGPIVGSTGLASLTFSIPSGKVLIAAMEYSIDADTWVLTAATVSA